MDMVLKYAHLSADNLAEHAETIAWLSKSGAKSAAVKTKTKKIARLTHTKQAIYQSVTGRGERIRTSDHLNPIQGFVFLC